MELLTGFDNPGAVNFTTWLAGDNATFTNAAGTLSIGVSVISQLDNPVSGTEAITYGFSVALAGTGQTIADTTVGASHVMTVGSDDAPDVEIVSSLANSFVNMTATGAGQFVFDLECQSSIAGNNCSGVDDMTTWEVVLVEDTYGGSPSLTNLNALFPGSPIVTVSGGIGTNGGFTTPTLTGQMRCTQNQICFWLYRMDCRINTLKLISRLSLRLNNAHLGL